MASCVAAPLLAWLGYACIAWAGYGQLQVDRRPDPLLDRFMPVYEVSERHEIGIAAEAPVTYAAARGVALVDSPLIRTIFSGRDLLMREPHGGQAREPIVAQMLALGWGVLAERPGRELVMGAITQPWEPHVVFHRLPPAQFAAFDRPGYAKIVWTIEAEPQGNGRSIFRTVTRVATTDAESRRKFRRYWSIFSPGILLIRFEALRIVRASAQGKAQLRHAVEPSDQSA